MKKVWVVFPMVIASAFLGLSKTNGSRTEKSQLEGTWKLVSGQPLPKGAEDIKIISGGHFVFVAYETNHGKPLYTGGGTYILNGNSYTEPVPHTRNHTAHT